MKTKKTDELLASAASDIVAELAFIAACERNIQRHKETLEQYADGKEVYTHDYGHKVKLENGKLVVTEVDREEAFKAQGIVPEQRTEEAE